MQGERQMSTVKLTTALLALADPTARRAVELHLFLAHDQLRAAAKEELEAARDIFFAILESRNILGPRQSLRHGGGVCFPLGLMQLHCCVLECHRVLVATRL